MSEKNRELSKNRGTYVFADQAVRLGQPLCPESVKYVSGTFCKVCLRTVHRGKWRRRRDSNPRYPFGYNGFQDRRFQPLTHSSVSNFSVFCEPAASLPQPGTSTAALWCKAWR